MKKVFIFSLLLVLGMGISQFLDLAKVQGLLYAVTMTCLAYIMIQVGLEFTIDKNNLKSYATDYLVAATAAAFPWIFCAAYFVYIFGMDWQESLLAGRFAAPTSAGVLFTMLLAAGLGATWIFRKVRILAIFDDLDTILLMIPLKIMIVGAKPELGAIIVVIVILLVLAYRYLHSLKFPVGNLWILLYSIIIVAICSLVEIVAGVHLEVLLPAFVLGCVLYHPHAGHHHAPQAASRQTLPQQIESMVDPTIKAGFMFLVGCSLPKVQLGEITIGMAVIHVLLLTVLSNVGKCFPIFCYGKEATLRERIAVSVAMFPRGEVGAGVLLVALSYGISGSAIALAGMSLALNLLLTGFFIAAVIWLSSSPPAAKLSK